MPNDLQVGVLFVKSNCIAKLFFAIGVFFRVTTSSVVFLDFEGDFLITRVASSMINSSLCEFDESCIMFDGAFSIVRVSSYVFMSFERTDGSGSSPSKRQLSFKSKA